MSNRQIVLQEFLNSPVTKLKLSLYLWRERYYEVIPLTLAARRHSWAAGWVKRMYKGKTYMIREASRETLKKYYPNFVSIDKEQTV